MRQLNELQKDILSFYRQLNSIQDLPVSTYKTICEIHKFETIYHEIDRLLKENYLEPSKCFANYNKCSGNTVMAIQMVANEHSFICENCGVEKSYGGFVNV